jgi:Domain of unknown function (DUF4124)
MVRRILFVLTMLAGLLPATSACAAMYRCLGADGKVAYADRPCEVGQQSAGKVDRSGVRVPTTAEAAALAATAPAVTKPATAGIGADRMDLNQAGPSLILTACSVLVVQCVQPPDKTLDRCFTSAPRCASARPWLDGGSLACCPQACLDRYEGLRKAGTPPVKALDLALHGGAGAGNGCAPAR